MENTYAFEKKLALGLREKDGSYSKLDQFEHMYFMSYVEGKVSQSKASWTEAEKTLLPALISRLQKREEPIKKELKMHQDKLK